jgi:hypothetical protein
MKRTKWAVTYGGNQVARFSDFGAACRFARAESRPSRLVLTREFLHLARTGNS